LGQVKIQFQGLLSEIGLTKLQSLLCSVDLISKQLCLCYSVVYVWLYVFCVSVMSCIVAKQCVLEQKLLLTAYRKSHMRNRLVPKWMTLTFV